DHATGLHRFRLFLENIRFIRFAGELILSLDEKPVLPLLPRLSVHADQMPSPFEFFSGEFKLQVPFLVLLMCIAGGFPTPRIPDDYRAAAIFTLGYRAFAARIFERMILDMHRKALFAGNEAWTQRHGPAFQDAVHFEAKVIMQPARIMFLHDEEITFRPCRLAPRLAGQGEIAFLAVGFKWLSHDHPALLRDFTPDSVRDFGLPFFALADVRPPPSRPALLRRASFRSITSAVFGAAGFLSGLPSIFALIKSARAAS